MLYLIQLKNSVRSKRKIKQSYQKNKCVPHKLHGDCTKITCGKALVVNYLHELSRNYLLYGDDFFKVYGWASSPAVRVLESPLINVKMIWFCKYYSNAKVFPLDKLLFLESFNLGRTKCPLRNSKGNLSNAVLEKSFDGKFNNIGHFER